MDLLAQYVMNGVMLGLMYALVALGFTLFFGVLNVIQFAHGDVLTAGAFAGLAGYAVAVHAGVEAALPQLLTVALAATLSMALLGAVLGRALVLPLKGAPALNVLLATLMGGTALRECIRLFYPGGSQPQRFPALLPSASWSLGRFTVRLDNLLMLATGVGLILGLSLVLQRTRLGLAIRAVAQDEETARTMGIDFRRVVLLTFAIGSALAAFAGVMAAPIYQVTPSMGSAVIVVVFAVVVVGGMGSILGSIVTGLGLGLVEELTKFLWSKLGA